MKKNERRPLAFSAFLSALAAFFLFMPESFALDISNRYRSPRNPERRVRKSTTLIILHTTEAPERSSLNKLSERGEAHYCVTPAGRIFAIVDRDREAYHAGRSMWNGKEDVDKFSVGIECVGYHDKPMGIVQLKAIAALVKELKRMYRLDDNAVICHSHVAYGAPNKWQKRRHRGRKRCGMLFAMPTVRRILDLSSKPRVDPDTRAGRLTVGDKYLRGVLYGSVDTMVAHYPARRAPSPSSRTPVKGSSPARIAYRAGSAIAARAKGDPRSIKELKSRGYSLKGVISKGKTAIQIAGAKWNSPSTYYVVRGKVTPGSKINPKRIEVGAAVWMK